MASNPRHDPGAASRPMTDEADIGSGEKTPAQVETDKMIRDIPPLPPGGGARDGKEPPAPP